MMTTLHPTDVQPYIGLSQISMSLIVVMFMRAPCGSGYFYVYIMHAPCGSGYTDS